MARRVILVDILSVFFGIGTWICINGLWVELPLLVLSQPEGWALASYMSVAICLANIAPLLYSALKWLFPKYITEKPTICLTMTIGCIATLLLALYWNRTSVISGREHSTALLTLLFFLAMVDCSSRVLFLPFMANFKEIYLASYFIGEGMSGFVPSIFALGQGVGGNPDCINITSEEDGSVKIIAQYPEPRFSVELFFYLLFGMMILSAISFVFLNHKGLVRNALAMSPNASSNLLGNPSLNSQNYESTSPNLSPLVEQTEPLRPEVARQQRLEEILDDDEEPVSSASIRIMGVTPRLKPKPRLRTASEAEMDARMEAGGEPDKQPMSLYLLGIQFFVCSLSNGIFPSIQPFSCLPYGTEAYHWSVTLSSMTNPAVCFLDFFLPKPTKGSVSAVTAVALGIGAYVMSTATLSPHPPLQNSIAGVMLLVTSWVLMVGLFTYVRISNAVIFRARGKEGLFWIGAVTQIGSATGALVMFFIINYSTAFQSFQPCQSQP